MISEICVVMSFERKYPSNKNVFFVEEKYKGRGQKKNCEKAVRLTALGGEGGSPPLSLTTSICENFDPFLSFIKRQNNPKYGNLSRNFHIFLTASGEGRGGSTQAVSLTAFSQFFFECDQITTKHTKVPLFKIKNRTNNLLYYK